MGKHLAIIRLKDPRRQGKKIKERKLQWATSPLEENSFPVSSICWLASVQEGGPLGKRGIQWKRQSRWSTGNDEDGGERLFKDKKVADTSSYMYWTNHCKLAKGH